MEGLSGKRRRTETTSLSGQQLLSLARSSEETPEQTLQAFVDAVRVVSIHGVLQGNEEIAHQVLKRGGDKNGGKKRKKKNGGKERSEGQQLPTLDVQLVILACLKGLDSTTSSHADSWLVCLAADLITAIVRYIQQNYTTPTVVFLAEFELISGSAKAILQALIPHCKNSSHPRIRLATLRAATRIVGVMPNRFKRSLDVVVQLRESALMNTNMHIVPQARLYSALAMVATMETTAAETWSRHVNEATLALNFVAQRAVGQTPNPLEGSWKNVVEDTWFPSNTLTGQGEESIAQQLVTSTTYLVCTLKSLLARDAIGVGTAASTPVIQQLIGARIDVGNLLLTIETLLSFPVSAERIWKKTKKRLRKEPLEGGLHLSPATLVSNPLATQMLKEGFNLLNAAIRSLGVTVLLPFSRRIFNRCYQSLLSVTPLVLRSLVDPTALILSNKHDQGKTTAGQVAAFASLGTIASVLGLDNSAEETAKSIRLACGYVVAQLQGNDQGQTLTDQKQVIFAAIEFIVLCLSRGDMLPRPVRELVDSVARTCFVASRGHPLLAGELAHTNLMEMGIAVIGTPHSDGALCHISLCRELLQLAKRRPHSLKSATAVQMCNTILSPRLSALHIVTRQPPKEDRMTMDAESILAQIEATRESLVPQTPLPVPQSEATNNETDSSVGMSSRKEPASQARPRVVVHDEHEVIPKENETIKTCPKLEWGLAKENGGGSLSKTTTEQDSGDDDDMPMIVDAGPDEEDA